MKCATRRRDRRDHVVSTTTNGVRRTDRRTVLSFNMSATTRRRRCYRHPAVGRSLRMQAINLLIKQASPPASDRRATTPDSFVDVARAAVVVVVVVVSVYEQFSIMNACDADCLTQPAGRPAGRSTVPPRPHTRRLRRWIVPPRFSHTQSWLHTFVLLSTGRRLLVDQTTTTSESYIFVK